MKGQMVYVLIVILGVNWSQQLRVRIQGGKSTTDFMWIRTTICWGVFSMLRTCWPFCLLLIVLVQVCLWMAFGSLCLTNGIDLRWRSLDFPHGVSLYPKLHQLWYNMTMFDNFWLVYIMSLAILAFIIHQKRAVPGLRDEYDAQLQVLLRNTQASDSTAWSIFSLGRMWQGRKPGVWRSAAPLSILPASIWIAFSKSVVHSSA
jgi:hypothetical protein